MPRELSLMKSHLQKWVDVYSSPDLNRIEGPAPHGRFFRPKVHRRLPRKYPREAHHAIKPTLAACVFLFLSGLTGAAQDLPNSNDPAGMKRYEGSELIGYRAPKFDEYLMPLGPPTDVSAPAYEKSKPVDGQIGYYTYLAPAGRSPAELFRNYKQEFQRLGIEVQYEKAAGQHGWFGPGFDKIAEELDIAQILAYDEADERLLVGKSRDAKPNYTWCL